MKKSSYTDSQVMAILKQAEAGPLFLSSAVSTA